MWGEYMRNVASEPAALDAHPLELFLDVSMLDGEPCFLRESQFPMMPHLVPQLTLLGM
jgi:hypothetical protein